MQNIEIVNDVLLLSGERPVVSLVTPVGRKGALSVSTAVEDIILLNAQWTFLKVSEQPVSVNEDILTHLSLREVSMVTYKGRQLEPVQIEDLPFVQNSYALLDDNHIQVSFTGAVASDFLISGNKTTNYDISDPQALIPLPERFRPILLVQSVYRMATDHLGDAQQAQAKAQEFAVMARQMIKRESGIGLRNRTMYRRRTR